MISNGVIISGALRDRYSSPGVRVEEHATAERSVIMDSTIVGANALVRNAIIDKNVVIPPGAQIGVDKEHDLARGFAVSDGGVTAVGRPAGHPRSQQPGGESSHHER